MRRRKGKKGKTEEIVQEIPGRRKFCQFQDITHFHSSVSFTLSFPSSVVVFIFASALLKIWVARDSAIKPALLSSMSSWRARNTFQISASHFLIHILHLLLFLSLLLSLSSCLYQLCLKYGQLVIVVSWGPCCPQCLREGPATLLPILGSRDVFRLIQTHLSWSKIFKTSGTEL